MSAPSSTTDAAGPPAAPTTYMRIGMTMDEALAPPILPISLDPTERAVARRLFTLLSLPDGQRLATRGTIALRGFVIVSGRAVAERPRSRSVVLSAGSTVGLASLRSSRPQRATVHAVSDMQLLAIGRGDAFRLDLLLPRLAVALDTHATDTYI